MGGILKVTDVVSGTRNGVLFYCVHNAARSQMAEGFARFLGPADLIMYSAGSAPSELSPYAVKVMREVGVDISGHHAKSIDEIPEERIAVAVSLCTGEECPIRAGAAIERLSWPLPDPANGAESEAPEAEILLEFRRIRDQIRELVSALF